MTYRSTLTLESVPDDAAERPVVVVITPVAPPPQQVLAQILKMEWGEYRLWLLAVRARNATVDILSRMVAFGLLDDARQLVAPGMMPIRPASTMLLHGNVFQHSRSRTLPPWAVQEIERLAQLLVEHHQPYLDGIGDTLRGMSREGFGPLPDGFIFSDPTGLAKHAPPPPRLTVDLSGSDADSLGLEWWQIATRNYLRDRYLRHCTDEQLTQRLMDILSNLHVIEERGLISFQGDVSHSRYWLTRLGEVDVEMKLRGSEGAQSRNLREREWVGSLRGNAIDKAVCLTPLRACKEPYLVKYGAKTHIEAALRSGTMRIAPASSFKEPSFNAAIRDNELQTKIDLDPLFWPNSHNLWQGFPVTGERLGVTLSARSDYYVFCSSSTLTSRLLFDFGFDACLVIHDPDAFVARLEAAMSTQLDGWACHSGPVEYYDPMDVSPAEIDICHWKHFRYAYQREFRTWWIPRRGAASRLPVIYPDLGSLEDIAEMVVPTPSLDLTVDAQPIKGDTSLEP